MGFSDIFKKDFLASYTSETVSVPHIVAVLFITCIIGCYIFMVYRVVTRKTFYSRNFNISIAAIAVITAGIILAVQSSIVISLGYGGCSFYCQIQNGSEGTHGSGISVSGRSL